MSKSILTLNHKNLINQLTLLPANIIFPIIIYVVVLGNCNGYYKDISIFPQYLLHKKPQFPQEKKKENPITIKIYKRCRYIERFPIYAFIDIIW